MMNLFYHLIFDENHYTGGLLAKLFGMNARCYDGKNKKLALTLSLFQVYIYIYATLYEYLIDFVVVWEVEATGFSVAGTIGRSRDWFNLPICPVCVCVCVLRLSPAAGPQRKEIGLRDDVELCIRYATRRSLSRPWPLLLLVRLSHLCSSRLPIFLHLGQDPAGSFAPLGDMSQQLWSTAAPRLSPPTSVHLSRRIAF